MHKKVIKRLKRPLVKAMLVLCMTVPSILCAELRIIDADSIELNGQKIRFSGIDAPEKYQVCKNVENEEYACGLAATRALQELVKNWHSSKISCSSSGRDFFGRLLSECFVSDININSWLVKSGWALAYRKYSLSYLADEQFAKQHSKGLWQGDFVEPWKWRRGDRLASIENAEATDCKIKGNISRSGEKIFHVIGSSGYVQTKISTDKGEQWFCSEQDAILNGWRKSKR